VRTPSLRNAGNYWCKYSRLYSSNECRRFFCAERGLFCANFSARRGTFAPCNNCWCGPCYQPLGVKEHPVRLKVDGVGDLLEDADDAKRFLVTRAGDHLMVLFQCEVCHFRNVTRRDPVRSLPRDQEILEFMRRATLDGEPGEFDCQV
jgi:hypothetical protein